MPLKFNDPKYGPIDVHTYSDTYIGRANLVTATLASDNSVYQQLDLDLGPDEGHADRARHGHHSTARRLSRPRAWAACTHGVSPLEMANAYATIARRRRNRVRPIAVDKVMLPRRPTSTTAGRQGAAPRSSRTASPTRRPRSCKQNVAGRHRHRGADRLPGRRQDRHDRRLHRRVVRRLHAAAVDLGVGRPRQPTRTPLGAGAAGGAVAAPIWGAYMKTAQRQVLRRLPQAQGAVRRRAVLRQVLQDRRQGQQGRPGHLRRPTPTGATTWRPARPTAGRPATARPRTPTTSTRARRSRPGPDTDARRHPAPAPGPRRHRARPAPTPRRPDHRRRRRHGARRRRPGDRAVHQSLAESSAPGTVARDGQGGQGRVRGRGHRGPAERDVPVQLDNDHEVLGHVAGKMRRFRIRILPGDRVRVELSPLRPRPRPHHLPPPLNARPAVGDRGLARASRAR